MECEICRDKCFTIIVIPNKFTKDPENICEKCFGSYNQEQIQKEKEE